MQVTMRGVASMFLVILATSPTRAGAEEEPLRICKLSVAKKFEVLVNESVSDAQQDYKEHEDFKFWTINKRHAFVQAAQGILPVGPLLRLRRQRHVPAV